jgi:hypothetical protein
MYACMIQGSNRRAWRGMVLLRLDIIGSRNLKSATDNLRGNFRHSYSEDGVSQPSSIPYTPKSRSATYIAPFSSAPLRT